jgi:cystathionine beta-synthase
MRVVDSVLELIGQTPMVRLQRVGKHTKSNIYVKLEYMNPGGSVKDRPALRMIEDAERSGALKPGGTIVEATSGNTGMGLAMAASVKGYSCIFVMPDKMSEEKIRALRAWGARVVITPTDVEPEDPRSYYQVAQRLARETPNAFYGSQYHNQSNPAAHYESTGPEIWEQLDGKVDVFVSAAGTGGTISGTGRYLKEKNPGVRVVAADPIGSVYYDYFYTGKLPPAHSYKVEGFGEDFLPTCMHFDVVDEVVRVTDKECFDVTRRLVREEGILTGGSSGGAVAAAIKIAEKSDRPLNIVTVMCDSASRYLSKIFDDGWMREHGFLGDELQSGTVADVLARKSPGPLIVASPEDSVRNVIEMLKKNGISQVPVLSSDRIVGLVNEKDLLAFLVGGGDPASPVTGCIESNFAIVEPSNRIAMLGQFFSRDLTVFVVLQNRLVGVITKIDFIDFVSHTMR